MSDQDDFIEDSRYSQCTREMWATVVLFVINILLVGGVSLWLGLNKTADSMTYILGFPAWFFWGGIMGTAIFCILPYFMIKFFYKDMSIEAEDER
ncbi:YhdT family protein [Cytobacillus firmus]|uniref:YhdT family protein n=1 Tax=Cytobacillus firmus TaxID=1399 RepID=UPI00237B4B9B|nr:YhdT family protein [Cytobacillus firmus]MDD9311832.1 YhdT family protein [Cytobacillus firmus]